MGRSLEDEDGQAGGSSQARSPGTHLIAFLEAPGLLSKDSSTTHSRPGQPPKSSPQKFPRGSVKRGLSSCALRPPQHSWHTAAGALLGPSWRHGGRKPPPSSSAGTALTVHLSGGDFQASVICFLLLDPTHVPRVTTSLTEARRFHLPPLSSPLLQGHHAPRLYDLGLASLLLGLVSWSVSGWRGV